MAPVEQEAQVPFHEVGLKSKHRVIYNPSTMFVIVLVQTYAHIIHIAYSELRLWRYNLDPMRLSG